MVLQKNSLMIDGGFLESKVVSVRSQSYSSSGKRIKMAKRLGFKKVWKLEERGSCVWHPVSEVNLGSQPGVVARAFNPSPLYEGVVVEGGGGHRGRQERPHLEGLQLVCAGFLVFTCVCVHTAQGHIHVQNQGG